MNRTDGLYVIRKAVKSHHCPFACQTCNIIQCMGQYSDFSTCRISNSEAGYVMIWAFIRDIAHMRLVPKSCVLVQLCRPLREKPVLGACNQEKLHARSKRGGGAGKITNLQVSLAILVEPNPWKITIG